MKVKSLGFKIFLAAAMVLFGICALPCFGNFAVSVAEKYLGRTLRDAPRWMGECELFSVNSVGCGKKI